MPGCSPEHLWYRNLRDWSVPVFVLRHWHHLEPALNPEHSPKTSKRLAQKHLYNSYNLQHITVPAITHTHSPSLTIQGMEETYFNPFFWGRTQWKTVFSRAVTMEMKRHSSWNRERLFERARVNFSALELLLKYCFLWQLSLWLSHNDTFGNRLDTNFVLIYTFFWGPR